MDEKEQPVRGGDGQLTEGASCILRERREQNQALRPLAEMKPQECVPILLRKESPSVLVPKDGKLLAATLLLALLSCSITALCLCWVAALQADLASLRAELRSHRAEQLPAPAEARAGALGAALEANAAVTAAPKGIFVPPAPGAGTFGENLRMKRAVQSPEGTGSFTFVPWLLSFKRGSALEEKENKILVKETGYFFIYGQVLYTGNTFAMGHLIQRKKVHVFGDELSLVTLFRCIQNMPETLPNNSCYSADAVVFSPVAIPIGTEKAARLFCNIASRVAVCSSDVTRVHSLLHEFKQETEGQSQGYRKFPINIETFFKQNNQPPFLAETKVEENREREVDSEQYQGQQCCGEADRWEDQLGFRTCGPGQGRALAMCR
ncbi:Tumor necrosis factor ligand superfamily member 13B [Tupaia chinensis]|uniref:Tumor necrosis factor ligand superfamily member 13B n=1 Tax=Tupaia chinensis TaxID=246437 RepID=L9JA93_TUPCH|nr:Tumor necrosis factor ligand superfamily member 13B [Tupaia chinensis]